MTTSNYMRNVCFEPVIDDKHPLFTSGMIPWIPVKFHQEMDSVTKAKAILSGSDPAFGFNWFMDGGTPPWEFQRDLDDFYDFLGVNIHHYHHLSWFVMIYPQCMATKNYGNQEVLKRGMEQGGFRCVRCFPSWKHESAEDIKGKKHALPFVLDGFIPNSGKSFWEWFMMVYELGLPHG